MPGPASKIPPGFLRAFIGPFSTAAALLGLLLIGLHFTPQRERIFLRADRETSAMREEMTALFDSLAAAELRLRQGESGAQAETERLRHAYVTLRGGLAGRLDRLDGNGVRGFALFLSALAPYYAGMMGLIALGLAAFAARRPSRMEKSGPLEAGAARPWTWEPKAVVRDPRGRDLKDQDLKGQDPKGRDPKDRDSNGQGPDDQGPRGRDSNDQSPNHQDPEERSPVQASKPERAELEKPAPKGEPRAEPVPMILPEKKPRAKPPSEEETRYLPVPAPPAFEAGREMRVPDRAPGALPTSISGALEKETTAALEKEKKSGDGKREEGEGARRKDLSRENLPREDSPREDLEEEVRSVSSLRMEDEDERKKEPASRVSDFEREEQQKAEVIKLARRGFTSSEISRRLRLSQDQVEILIRLKREKGSV